MDIKEARQVLHQYNQWRIGSEGFSQPGTIEVSESIEMIVKYLDFYDWADGLVENEETKRKYESECG